MLNKNLKSIFNSILFFILLTLPQISQAGFIPKECLDETAKNCQLEQFAQLFVNLYYFSLRYLGALALLMFVVGGIIWLTSGGNQERVARGKKILVGTTVGIIIVMGSFIIVTKLQEYIGVTTGEEETIDFTINSNNSTDTDIACRIQGGECMECKDDDGNPADCNNGGKNPDCTDNKKFIPGLCPADNSMCCVDETK